MNPSLALIAGIIVILYFLKVEHSNNGGVTSVIWLPTLWLFIAASKPLGVWFETPGVSIDAGSPLDRKFLISIIIAISLVLLIRGSIWTNLKKLNGWLIILVGYMFLSIFWSDIPAVSFKRFIREIIPFMITLLIISEKNPQKAVEALFRRVIYTLIPLSLVLIRFFPDLGRAYGRWSGGEMWVGVTMQKNGLGRLCLITVFFLIWSIMRNIKYKGNKHKRSQVRVELFLLVLALYLLKGPTLQAYSATAVASLIFGIMIYSWVIHYNKNDKKLYKNTFKFIAGTIIAFGLITAFVGGATVGAITETFGRDATLTGRTDIWAGVLPLAMEKPVLGHGVGGFWTSSKREYFKVSESHNGYLDIILNFGFIGVLIVTLFVFSYCRDVYTELKYDLDWASLKICFLFMALVHNISESSIQSLTIHLTAMIVFLSIPLNTEKLKVTD